MAVFHYLSTDDNGRIHKGVLEGDSSQHIRQQLRDKGLIPIEITKEETESSSKSVKFNYFKRQKSIHHAVLTLMTYQLGTLLSAGLPLELALLNISEQMDKTFFRTILLSLRARILEGHTLAFAMDEYPHLFPKLYRATIAAGEKSGRLDTVITRLANHLEQEENIRMKIQQAIIYPMLLMLISIAIIAFLMTYAMPKITSVFTETGQRLPTLTLILLAVTNIIKTYGIYILIFITLLAIGFVRLLKWYEFRYRVELFLLKMPIIKNAMIIVNAARFSRTLGILYAASVPVLEAMTAANSVITLLPMHTAVKEAIVQVEKGVSIHQALAQTGYFSKLSTQLIASGEASGKIELMLEKTALHHEQTMLKWIATALSLFEPMMILLMGAMVLFIVLAILLPIFDMSQLIN